MFRDPFEGLFVEEDTIVHFGVKGMKWGVRKDQAVSFMRSGSPQSQMGKQLVASMLISYGTIKLAKFAARKAKHTTNKILNKIDPYDFENNTGKLRETDRYYDKKVKDYVYLYN